MNRVCDNLIRRCKPIAEWPDTDQRQWRQAVACSGVFDAGTRSEYSPASLSKLAKGYGRWLTWLEITGQLEPDIPAANRITLERARQYVKHLADIGITPAGLANRLRELLDAGLTFDPKRDWAWLRQAVQRAKCAIVPARDKASKVVDADRLLDLGMRLMAESDKAGALVRQSTAFRDGLIIAFLTLCPLRRRNLAMIQIGTHLIKAADGKGYLLEFDGHQTKTKRPIRLPWPAALEDALKEWMNIHRPRLVEHVGRWNKPAGNSLWLSHDGSPLTPTSIYFAICKRTKQAFGHSVNPHLFRDCAVTTFGIVDPANIHAAAPLLGHTSLKTTEAHYQQAQMHHSVKRYQDTIMLARKAP